ncbi:MAG: hypothetical protein LBO69_04945 [Ignavibacteria bacterium]|jgi:hypothetical protein|nr:hypothetical protein [Ignavibacteria bacterium]
MKNISFILAIILFTGCSNNYSKIEYAVKQNLLTYPASQLQDVYKNFYQDRFGSEHLISDTAAVLRYTRAELEQMDTTYMPMVEDIGWEHNFCRVSLQLLKQKNIEPDTLSMYFIKSATMAAQTKGEHWKDEWHTITKAIEKNGLQMNNYEQDKKDIDSILKINPKAPIHHSKQFNEAYKPHYRVINKTLIERLMAK